MAKPKAKKTHPISRAFERFACGATKAAGHTGAFVLAFTVIVAWAVTGPLFHFSDTWQLVINTGTTIVTFLMVFLIQHTQNKDSMAVQLKLDEIIQAIPAASNKMIDIEDMDADAIEDVRARYQEMADKLGNRLAGKGAKQSRTRS